MKTRIHFFKKLTASILISISSLTMASGFGIVNFNVNKAPIENPGIQPVTFYGCNNTIINTAVEWGKDGQVLANIPYGPQKTKNGRDYFISKYYMASPPVPVPPKPSEPTNIGLLNPDNFSFSEYYKNPAQIVNLDYTILQPVYLNYVEANYKYKPTIKELKKINSIKHHSCKDQGVDTIPMNIQCSDFPWFNGAKGASGIAQLIDSKGLNQLFLPSLAQNSKQALQCKVTVLDDIMLDHEVFVKTSEGPRKSFDLTYFQKQGKDINLICKPREPKARPPGCKSKKN